MSAANQNHSPQNAAAEAAEWFIDLQGAEVSREQQEAFADWLRRSPVHIEEFLQLTALQGDLSRLPGVKNLDVNQLLIHLNLSDADDNIIPLSPINNENSDSPVQPSARPVPLCALETKRGPGGEALQKRGSAFGARLVFASAATLALITIGLWFSGPMRDFLGKQDYKTDIGEQRSLTLADGSQIQINALSNLSATVNKTVRELQLHDGEALFRVAKDPAHPFRVHTPQATIEAKGTQFNVQVTRGRTVVSLLEGHVLITPPTGPSMADRSGGSAEIPAPILLNPGEEISIAEHATAPPKPRTVDLKAAVAWTQHRLVFEDTPLSDVIAEFSRYTRQPFAIHDPALRDVHITVSFDSQSTQAFADSLAANGTLRVVRQPSGAWLIERK